MSTYTVPTRHTLLIACDRRYEALCRRAVLLYSWAPSASIWATWRLRQRWARERARIVATHPVEPLGAMTAHLVPLPCAPSLADPDPHALQQWDDDGGRRRVCPSHPCSCPDCE